MPKYLVSYDLRKTEPAPHKQFLTSAEPEGWLYVYQTDEGVLRLPNTTLWGVFATREEARAAFARAVAAAGRELGSRIVLEKRVIAGLADCFVRSDQVKAPDRSLDASTMFERCRRHQLEDEFFS